MENARKFSEDFLHSYLQIKCPTLYGRYINFGMIEKLIHSLPEEFLIRNEGFSVLGTPIISVEIGTGSKKILAWSQMHGNETTTTKAAFDFFNFLKMKKNPRANAILKECRIKFIPMLNPDGAEKYTRTNANNVDLNRDAFECSQPESKVLREVFDAFKPDFCFNLHDQRTIFSAGFDKIPATLSFLAPSFNKERTVDQCRSEAMKLIAGIVDSLPKDFQNQVGRYDDAFNINCTGDFFMNKNVPTLLFEAGHYPDDYQREESRKFVVLALIQACRAIAASSIENYTEKAYFQIPENRKLFYDVIIRKAKVADKIVDIGVQFQEQLKNQTIEFVPVVQEIKKEMEKSGHREILAQQKTISNTKGQKIEENEVLHQIKLGNTIKSIKFG